MVDRFSVLRVDDVNGTFDVKIRVVLKSYVAHQSGGEPQALDTDKFRPS